MPDSCMPCLTAGKNVDFVSALTDIFRNVATALEPNEAFVTEVTLVLPTLMIILPWLVFDHPS